LIRIARLFPHELNLKKTAKDVEELASLLAEGECDVVINDRHLKLPAEASQSPLVDTLVRCA
jgi:hypothetical protein